MKTTMKLLPVLFLALLFCAFGCAPEATELDTPEESAPPVAEVVIKLVEDDTALELTLTNTGDIELFTALYGRHKGFELIVKDASGESLVPLAKERRRIPETYQSHIDDWTPVLLTLAPGQSIDAVLPLSVIFPFEPGQEYSLQATRSVRCRNDMPVKSSQDENGVVTSQGYDDHVITSNTLHFEAPDGSR